MMNLCWIHDESEQVREQYGFLTQTCGYIDFEGRGRLCEKAILLPHLLRFIMDPTQIHHIKKLS